MRFRFWAVTEPGPGNSSASNFLSRPPTDCGAEALSIPGSKNQSSAVGPSLIPCLPCPIAVAVRSFPEDVNHDHTRNEASHMRPKGDATRSLAGFGDGRQRATQKISHEPVAEHQPCRNVKEEYRRKPDQHSR